MLCIVSKANSVNYISQKNYDAVICDDVDEDVVA